MHTTALNYAQQPVWKAGLNYHTSADTEKAQNHSQNRNKYKDESISNQPNLFAVEIHLFFFDVIAL